MANLPDIENDLLQYKEQLVAPETPSAGVIRVYAKTDGLLYFKDDAGVEYPIYSPNNRGVSFQIFGLDLATTLKTGAIAPCNLVVLGGKIVVGVAPTGADLECDVHKEGVSMFTTQTNRPIISAGNTSAVIVAPDVVLISKGEYVEWQIDQIGSTIAGKDLSATLYCYEVI